MTDTAVNDLVTRQIGVPYQRSAEVHFAPSWA